MANRRCTSCQQDRMDRWIGEWRMDSMEGWRSGGVAGWRHPRALTHVNTQSHVSTPHAVICCMPNAFLSIDFKEAARRLCRVKWDCPLCPPTKSMWMPVLPPNIAPTQSKPHLPPKCEFPPSPPGSANTHSFSSCQDVAPTSTTERHQSDSGAIGGRGGFGAGGGGGIGRPHGMPLMRNSTGTQNWLALETMRPKLPGSPNGTSVCSFMNVRPEKRPVPSNA
eukprot:312671-Chlamydomonas_euryale.AAC.2